MKLRNNTASIRISVKRKYLKNKYEEYPDGSYIIEGTVVKNRWGLKDKVFNLFVLSGKGIHFGLTALYDCLNLGLATKSRTIKIRDVSFGTMREVVQQAHDGNDDFFEPFVLVLADKFEVNTDEEMEDDTESEEDAL